MSDTSLNHSETHHAFPVWRLLIVSLFIGLDTVLGILFIQQNKIPVPSWVNQQLSNYGIELYPSPVPVTSTWMSQPATRSTLPANEEVLIATPSAKPPTVPQSTFQEARDVSDSEVFAALNQYRADHHVHALVTDQNLCQYAEKRVQDLVKVGSLDNHEGFKQDFADQSNLPEPIQNYSGGEIGENLASQYCINGTTGESFVAQTGTALIEWCFDSSQKGHREAQLNSRYNAVCVRHAQHMYVVIFGE